MNSSSNLPEQQSVFAWERVYTNAEGMSLPWPTAQTDHEAVWSFINQRKTGNLRWVDPLLFDSYETAFGLPEEELLWAGIRGRHAEAGIDILASATFGDRRETFAQREGENRFSIVEFALYAPGGLATRPSGERARPRRLPEDVPAAVALCASAFEPSKRYGHAYQLREDVADFDSAVRGVLLLAKQK